MSLNTKLTRNFLNQLKNVPRNYTFLAIFLNTSSIKESIGKEKWNHQFFKKN